MVSPFDENRAKGPDMTGTRSAAILISLSTIGLGSAAASPQAGRDGSPAQTVGTVGAGRGAAAPAFRSPEVMSDRRVTFRIFAPKADEVRLAGTDIPHNSQGLTMAKADNGVWEVTIGPLEPGSYRYNFNVSGVSVIDPRSPAISESNNNVWSLVHVPGAAFMDTSDVPHGAVAAVTYYSTALQKVRRMHVYTPPGYEVGGGKFPVFYLLHGAGDADDSWTSVGRAGFILDNLIAAKKATPMIVVMPAGHTSQTTGGRGAAPGAAADEFEQDFVKDIVPYVEKSYRVLADRPHRAIAGLSMGGSQTLNIATSHLDQFTYIGVFSSGLISMFGGGRGRGPAPGPGAAAPPAPAVAPDPAWEQQHMAALDNAAAKKGLKLFWFATGSEDALMPTTKSTVELFKKHGFSPAFKESAGGHTWANWRDYLNEFAPQLFK
jgi:enterochelin esterase family protein